MKIKDKITFRNGAVLYFFKYNKKKYVLLNRFLSYGSGLTDDELRNKICQQYPMFQFINALPKQNKINFGEKNRYHTLP